MTGDAARAEPDDQARRSETREEPLATSSPDFNHMMMMLVRYVFEHGGKFGLMIGSLIAILMLLFIVGLPAMTGATVLVDKVSQGASANRAFQLEMFKLQTDLELKKMDRTMLGDGAMKTLESISAKLDQQGEALQSQRDQLTNLAAQVSKLDERQALADRRLNSVSAEQQRQRETIQRQRGMQ